MLPEKIVMIDDKDQVNIKEQLLRYLSRWYWFLLGAIICLILAHIYLRYVIPEYSATATILVKDDKKGGIISELSAFSEMDMAGKIKSTVDNEIEVLRSRTITEFAVQDLKLHIRYFSQGKIKTIELYKSTPIKILFTDDQKIKKPIKYRVDSNDGRTYTLFDSDGNELGNYKFGELVTKVKNTFTIINKDNLNTKFSIIITANSPQFAAQIFSARLKVDVVNEKTSVVKLSVVDPVKLRAEEYLNAVVSNYNKDAINDKGIVFRNTSNFIDDRLRLIAGELGDVERVGESYKKSNQVTDIVSEAGIFLQNASEFERAFLETETQLRVVASLRDFVSKAGQSDLIPANVLTPTAGDISSAPSLISEYNTLLLERSRLIQSAGPQNSKIILLDSQIASLKNNVISNLDRLSNTLEIKRRDLSQQRAKTSGKISEIPTQEREYKGILRQQNIKEALYLYLLQKREETAISLASTAPNAKIIDVAIVSSIPVSPRPAIIYLAALFFGCFIPFAIIYLSDLLDTKIHDFNDLKRLSVPFVGDVPKSVNNVELVSSHSRSSTAEALRIIRTNLEFMLNQVPQGLAKTIFVTSTIPKEGKTFISINLAATISLSGKKVLLLAMDIRNPKLDEYLNIPVKGLTNFLSTPNVVIEDYIVPHENLPNFFILPPGVIPPNPAELLMSPKVDALFTKLKSEYDYIVVDTAPVSLVTDTLIIGRFADSFVYVARANHLDKEMLSIPENLYKESKLPNMSILLNDTEINRGYGYGGYGYGYGRESVVQPWYMRWFKKQS